MKVVSDNGNDENVQNESRGKLCAYLCVILPLPSRPTQGVASSFGGFVVKGGKGKGGTQLMDGQCGWFATEKGLKINKYIERKPPQSNATTNCRGERIASLINVLSYSWTCHTLSKTFIDKLLATRQEEGSS